MSYTHNQESAGVRVRHHFAGCRSRCYTHFALKHAVFMIFSSEKSQKCSVQGSASLQTQPHLAP